MIDKTIRPTLGADRVDNKAFWTLRLDAPRHIGGFYELRVRFNAMKQVTTFFYVNRAEHDDVELLSPAGWEMRIDDVIEHDENVKRLCPRHDAMPEDQFFAEQEARGATQCVECNARDTRQQAIDLLESVNVRCANEHQIAVYTQLRRHWEAFALLFNPEWTL